MVSPGGSVFQGHGGISGAEGAIGHHRAKFEGGTCVIIKCLFGRTISLHTVGGPEIFLQLRELTHPALKHRLFLQEK